MGPLSALAFGASATDRFIVASVCLAIVPHSFMEVNIEPPEAKFAVAAHNIDRMRS